MIGAFVISPLPSLLNQTLCTARPLGSAGVTPLHCYYGPSRHRLAFARFPGLAGYTSYVAPPISRWDEDGFSSCLACPCLRAVPTTRRSDMTFQLVCVMPCCLRPTIEVSAFGLILTRPLLGSLALRPDDSLTIPWMALSVGFIRFVSSADATQATEV